MSKMSQLDAMIQEKAQLKGDNTMNSTCPKCGGMTYQETTIGLPQNHCANCGLFHEVGGATESLKKQILGEMYEHTRKEGIDETSGCHGHRVL